MKEMFAFVAAKPLLYRRKMFCCHASAHGNAISKALEEKLNKSDDRLVWAKSL